jgi:hypothetical protein
MDFIFRLLKHTLRVSHSTGEATLNDATFGIGDNFSFGSQRNLASFCQCELYSSNRNCEKHTAIGLCSPAAILLDFYFNAQKISNFTIISGKFWAKP